jgi:uncharacterized protein YaiI (UPF0178 family)
MAALITKIIKAVEDGDILVPFTTADIVNWVEGNSIINDRNGRIYARKSISSILSNSDRENNRYSNRNTKLLCSKKIGNKKHYYLIESL